MSTFFAEYPSSSSSGGGVTSLNSLTGALTLVGAGGITITPSGSNITITGTGGSVTSVGLADSTGLFNISGSPVTTSGVLTLASLKSQTANTFFAAPNGSSGAPTFRIIVAADLPSLSGTYVTQSEVGQPNGVASLDGSGKVPASQLPATVFEYQGLWNPATNTPTLQDSTGTNAFVYQVNTAFAGPIAGLNSPTMVNFQVGNIVIFSSAAGEWQQAAALTGVTSVNGATGAVTVNAINQLSGDVTTTLASGSQSKAASLVATSNSTLTTLSSLSLPTTQLSGRVTLAQLPQLASNTILGNNTGSLGNALALTVAQVNAILPVFTNTLNGLAPLSGGGTTTYLRADGTWAALTAPTKTLFTSGTGATYTTPTGAKFLKVTCIGGGGAGGGAATTTTVQSASAGGGGGGGCCIGYITSPVATYTYTVGAGGTPGTAGNVSGGGGGATTFGTSLFTANGGTGGAGGVAISAAPVNASGSVSGGTASGGSINFPGGGGGGGTVLSLNQVQAGAGGGTWFGLPMAVNSGSAASGLGVGTGGNGSAVGASSAASSGGSGSAGVILIEEFYQ